MIPEEIKKKINDEFASDHFPYKGQVYAAEFGYQLAQEEIAEKDAQIKILIDILAETVKKMAVIDDMLTKAIVKLHPPERDEPPPTSLLGDGL